MLNHVLHHGECRPGFREKGLGHREAEGNVIGDNENEAGRNRFGKMFGHQKGVTRKLEKVIPMWPSCRVFEIDGIAGVGSFNQQIQFSGDFQFARVERDPEMAPTPGQAIFAEAAALLQRFDGTLGRLALMHFKGRLSVKTHDVLIERNARAVSELLEIRNTKVADHVHFLDG